jgi:hypothetical protein
VISSLTPVTTAVPLIGVLSLTAIKDAYDDLVSGTTYVIAVISTGFEIDLSIN